MIRFRLKELIADKEFKENRRITFDEIAKATGVHRTTLSKIANQKGYNTTTEVLDKLCAYFDVQVDAVAEYVKSQENEAE
ncbi:helix-turn-helix domain-containing protein [Rheinheimera texasensis]|uniref:helix-turn-helix domain-containing protein n=1 Tax=Rheinheimera texasensis TaxID=306205 RepID=UPI0004E2681B|nr:helix-turn-helix transcriptional regulator [Rheinheimera texasensis]